MPYFSRARSVVFNPAPPQPPMEVESVSTRFGARIRYLRKQAGYTQVELAAYLGIDRTYISEVESGKKGVSLGYMETFAQGFRMSLSELTAGL